MVLSLCNTRLLQSKTEVKKIIKENVDVFFKEQDRHTYHAIRISCCYGCYNPANLVCLENSDIIDHWTKLWDIQVSQNVNGSSGCSRSGWGTSIFCQNATLHGQE